MAEWIRVPSRPALEELELDEEGRRRDLRPVLRTMSMQAAIVPPVAEVVDHQDPLAGLMASVHLEDVGAVLELVLRPCVSRELARLPDGHESAGEGWAIAPKMNPGSRRSRGRPGPCGTGWP